MRGERTSSMCLKCSAVFFQRCYRKALRSAIQRTSNSRIVEYAETVSLDESTHSTALNDLTLFQCIGDYLSADKADEVCRWCLTTLASVREYVRKVSATFNIPIELFKTLKACYMAASRDVQEEIEQWFLELPCVEESYASRAQNLTILFPASFWSDDNLATLLQRGDEVPCSNGTNMSEALMMRSGSAMARER